MAETYTYADALNFIRPQIPAVAEDTKAATICNIGTNLIWNAFDWRETIANFPPFWLTPWVQDYGAPIIGVPEDFLGLRTAVLTDLSNVPPAKYPLRCTRFLEPTHLKALPKDMSYQPEVKSFRVFPRPPAGLGAARFKIDGTYKKRPTLVTSSNYTATTLPFDDLYFQVWIEVLRWAGFTATGSEKAGQASKTPGGGIAYSGAISTAMAAINAMASNEGFNLGDTTVAPSEALSVGGELWTGRNLFLGF